MDYQREVLAFGEKIYLGKLEAKKAEERVAELEYEFARFQLEAYLAMQKQQAMVDAELAKREQQGQQPQGGD